MKKFYTFIKTVSFAFFAAFCASNATAAVNIQLLVGQYQFTADLTLSDDDWAEDFLTNNVVTVTEAGTSSVFFDNFVLAESRRRVQNSVWGGQANQISLQAQELTGSYGTGDMYFANADGINPTGSRDRENWYIVLTRQDDGTLTMPDFTVVTVTGTGDNDTEIIATYKNAVMTPISSGDSGEEAHDFSGTYTVSGTLTTYTDGSLSNATDTQESFQMVLFIDDNEITTFNEFAGYTRITAMNPSAGLFGSIDGDVLTLRAGANYLYSDRSSEDGYYICMGGATVGTDDEGNPTYDQNATVAFTYNSESNSYTLGDFTVWSRSYKGMGAYTILNKWSNLTVTYVGEAGVEEVVANKANGATVTTANGAIVINGAFAKAAVYDLAGRVITPAAAASTSVAPGVYVVNVDGKPFKVLVK